MRTRICRPRDFARSLLTPLLLVAAFVVPVTGSAQYFGKNKVPYERFRFEVLRTPHWDVHYYEPEGQAARDAARMLERWNSRLSSVMAHNQAEAGHSVR
jgi:hypothetical protein